MSIPTAIVTFVFLLIVLLFQMPDHRLPPASQRQDLALSSRPDWEALKTLPVWEVVQNAARPDTVRLLFDDDRSATEQAIDAKPAEIRDLLWLTVLADNMGYRNDGVEHGLHTFFFLKYGALAPKIVGALARTGLTERARIFGKAMALCGTPYPTDNEVREKLFAWSQPAKQRDNDIDEIAELNAFDRRMLARSVEFGSREAMWDAIGDVVTKSPTLTAWAVEERAKLSDDDRLRHLTSGLIIDSDSNEEVILASWPRPYQIIFLLDLFDGEVSNGGVHQFFYNSSGDWAPNVAVALRDVGLTKQAEAVDRGIAQFRAPYPLDMATRRRIYFNETMDRPFDKVLHDLTDDVDNGALQTAMINLAKRENILPH